MKNKIFPHSEWHKLIDEDRYKMMPPDKLLKTLSLTSSQIWADIGCGPGFFTIPLAQKVRKVFAVDISEDMLSVLQKQLNERGINNVQLMQSDCLLPVNASLELDGILLVNVFHEFADRSQCLQSYSSALKKTGQLVLVDWEYEEMEMGPPLSHRLPREKVIQELKDHHFILQSEPNLYPTHYVLIFSLSR